MIKFETVNLELKEKDWFSKFEIGLLAVIFLLTYRFEF